MAKTIIKELIIVLLLCLAIILVLGILLYEYVPIAKTIPNLVSYSTPQDVKQELLSSETVDENKIIMTYEVDYTDLNNYKKIQDYKPGKANPFSSYEKSITNEESEQTTTSETPGTENTKSTESTGNTNNTGNTGNTTNIENTTENNTTSSGGKFFQDKGTK